MVLGYGLGYGLVGNGVRHDLGLGLDWVMVLSRTDLASRPVQVVLDFIWGSAPRVFDIGFNIPG
jgi:hypothetical protein